MLNFFYSYASEGVVVLDNKENELICVKSYLQDNRTQEVTSCALVPSSIKFKFETSLKLSYYVHPKVYDVIKSKVTVQIPISKNFTFENTKNSLRWVSKTEHKKVVAKSVPRKENLDEIQFDLSKEKSKSFNLTQLKKNENESKILEFDAELVLKEINEDSIYRVCLDIASLNLTDDSLICSLIVYQSHDEENIYMGLLVIGILVIIYVIIVLVFWKCPPTFDDIDELLEKLPTSHVVALKELVESQEGNEDEEDDTPKPKNIEQYDGVNLRSRSHRRQSTVEKILHVPTNLAQPDSDDDDLEDKNQRELRKEMLKFRRMSRVSIGNDQDSHRVSVSSNQTRKQKPKVKFDKKHVVMDFDEVTGEQDIAKKIFNESRRRASIKPFKKAFDLNASSSESDS
jgi:hypothetical protein